MSTISTFLNQVIKTHKTGSATEHSYRPAFVDLFQAFDDKITAINEPKRIKCGAPDFIIQRDKFQVGHLEAKDVGVDIRKLRGREKEQQKRYLEALPNLIYSNGLDWDFYRDGELLESVSIAALDKVIKPDDSQYAKLESLLADFVVQTPISITSPEDLAKRMAGKAKLIKSVFHSALVDDLNSQIESDLFIQFEIFKDELIHDIEPEGFADIYAETICYGMFAARLHDDTLDTFSRYEALDKLPKTNPFLRNLFTYVAGAGLDERITWIIDDLADIFRVTDVAAIMGGFGRLTGRKDPFLHFYETFLKAYNPNKRKARGVWYTPEPVVNFIVRAVDEVLQTEFGLAEGLADTSKIRAKWDTGQPELTKAGKPMKHGRNAFIEKELHRVQVLDPATGTGTFLAAVIKQISEKIKNIAPGMWSSYVEKELMPRIHGFEIMMASYAMCHMKLDMMLTELGYKPSGTPPRQSVYLTNSLEEGDPPSYALPFARWLSEEVKQANAIKRDTPIMCVIGNPPYSGISQNRGGWITGLIESYKYVDGKHFGERRHWLHDDYVKFIRLAEEQIEKNGEGVLGFITNHGYLDNPTFRGMRWHLLQTFDRIWVLDLHGNTNRKEVDPSTGKPDINVFDIQQGVAIIIAVKKKGGEDKQAEIMHGDLWGDRDSKYETLEASKLSDDLFSPIVCSAPQYLFVPRKMDAWEGYQAGFAINEFMPENVTGIVTARDSLVIDYTAQGLKDRILRFIDPAKTDSDARAEFFPKRKATKYPPGDTRGWKLPIARAALRNDNWQSDIRQIVYRPFDTRAILYRPDMVDWGRFDSMSHMLRGENFALIFSRQAVRSDAPPVNVLVTAKIFDNRGVYSNKGISQSAPLYLYPDEQNLDQSRQINFAPKLYARLQKLGEHPSFPKPDEIAVFDYIYGVLHCPSYRESYAEFLKADFPRIPWPFSPEEFWDVSNKGRALREIHLMEPSAIGNTPYLFEGEGDYVVKKPTLEGGKIWVNETQYFADVPDAVWNLYIGGYQPAQKWLKDRKDRRLSFEDVKYYQCIIKVLAETHRIMRTINMTLGRGT